MTVLPYKHKNLSKKEQVAEMFDNISKRYDFLNHFLSAGVDFYWRKKAIQQLNNLNPKKILDVATGTGDFAIQALDVNPDEVIGVDISEGMLDIGRVKLKRKKLDNRIKLLSGDSEKLDFEDNMFDAVIVAFGVRNFEDLEKGLGDMRRVLRDNGMMVVLEFSKPTVFPLKQIFSLYFRAILPTIGKLISKDGSAYNYLPESVNEFPYGDNFLSILNKLGFKNTRCIPLTFGISTIYTGTK